MEFRGLYDPADERSSCGVGFLTRKDGRPSHELIDLAHESLCAVPHRGGISSEGVGDGGGVWLDLSVRFFRKLTGHDDLQQRLFGVGNFFVPAGPDLQADPAQLPVVDAVVAGALEEHGLDLLLVRDVPVDESGIRPAARRYQLPIRQWVFVPRSGVETREFDQAVHRCLLAIEARAYTEPELEGLYPISFSARNQVLKGRLISGEVIRYFPDLADPDHEIRTLYYHTRFSTNTDPHPTMAQPFRFIAHNGELNTDRKNRIAENTVARARGKAIVRPRGQSDSARLDQTIESRVVDDGVDLVTAVVSMMPPAWENDERLSPAVRAMLEYFSLREEKNDGPAALVFADGDVVGARLDRLGLRPLRTVETDEYLCISSEAGQIAFDPATERRRGRIEAGGMIYFDHRDGTVRGTVETLEMLAARHDYAALLDQARIPLADLPELPADKLGSPLRYHGDLARFQRYVAYSLNTESFRFLLDPMLTSGSERVSAMGYGNAINALSGREGGMAKFFTQRFAQVTNPPLDSVRESDGMTLRVALGAKPDRPDSPAVTSAGRQITVDTPILTHLDMVKIREQKETAVRRFELLFTPDPSPTVLQAAIDELAADIVAFAREQGGIAVVTDRHVSRRRAAIPVILAISAINQALIDAGMRLRVSVIAESGQISSSHHVAAVLGFGASAVYPLAVQLRAEEKFGEGADAAFDKFRKAAHKALMKTMGRVGLCTVESYIGGEFFEPAYLDTDDPALARYFPNLRSPVGGVGFTEIARDAAAWHERALGVEGESDIPLLGLFKERSEGAGHSYGAAAVRGFTGMTDEKLAFDGEGGEDALRLLTLNRLEDAFGLDDEAYQATTLRELTPDEIDRFEITPGYRDFVRTMTEERTKRPSALRDVLAHRPAGPGLPLAEVQPASEITRMLASGAMSHGALVASAHEAVAHGINMVGGLSNCGEGGEHFSRYGTIRGSRIKQLASGRFGVWAGYLADPMLQELEIKIGQGAKPGEGGQLPGPKVTVDIAAARGATPGVELVSPPPHHDTYSIEDLAQLIHDCKAAGVRVVVKLVSSEGIGTIAVGVAKAGADVINVAGGTGGTGAASVTSLKYAGRSAELGIAEVHQALSANGLRQKVVLRCSGAHQTAGDVVTSALLGGDSFEFGTTALMMLRCVMAKNCNIKCPAGITTNSEVFDGDPRALAQYLLNIAHEVREILADLGLHSLREARGRTDLLELVEHPSLVGALDLSRMLAKLPEQIIDEPVYLQSDYGKDDAFVDEIRAALGSSRSIDLGPVLVGNNDKSLGGRVAVSIERMLNHEGVDAAAAYTDVRGRRFLDDGTVSITTVGSAGQSYGLFCNDGMAMTHTGTANDGVGKGMCGGTIVMRNPGGGDSRPGGNVLIGNFALFGATGGRLFVAGEAGDRFAVRNSGATAVVEGVGDFGCEYMTNGAVVNLGSFGKGLGNGMSGGFLYQYDPSGDAERWISHDSLVLGRVVDVDFHERAVHTLLTWHVEATGSERAERILENWEAEREHFLVGTPRALLLYQDTDRILAAHSRKELLDELATALAGHQLRRYKLHFRDREPVCGGAVPGYGDAGSEEMFALLNNYTVLSLAQNVAMLRVPGATGPEDPRVAEATRKLLLTEDYAVVTRIQRYAREAVDGYSDPDLAALISVKRVGDYKEALARRNVLSVDAPGTYGWILHRDARNREALGRIPGFEELFAAQSVPDVAEMTLKAGAA